MSLQVSWIALMLSVGYRFKLQLLLPNISVNLPKEPELSILLTEDDVDVARFLTIMLQTLGHCVAAVAKDGMEAVRLVGELKPDLVIMDIDLPGMDGITATRHILKHTSVPVIISTGRTDGKALSDARELNIQAYLIKPFSVTQLKSTIAIALTQYGRHKDDRKKILQLSKALESKDGTTDADALTPERLIEIGLTPREAEVMHWVAQGKQNSEIATILSSSPRTVAKHVEHVFMKFKVESRVAAVTEARRLLEYAKSRPKK